MASYSDSFRNVTSYTGQGYRFVPTYIRPRDPFSPTNASTDIRPKEQQGKYVVCSLWNNSVNGNIWALAKITNNLANWVLISSGGSGPMLMIGVPAGTSPISPDVNGLVNFTSTAGTITITGSAGGLGLQNINFDLSGGGVAIDQVAVDAATGPGTNPVVPNASGQITVTGAQVATGTIGANVIRTDSLAANTYTIEIQRSTAVAGTDSTKNGVSHFDSAAFDVDANGFVQLNGGGIAVTAFDVDAHTAPGTDPVVPTAAGVVTVTGSSTPAGTTPVQTNSLAANTYTIQVQKSQAIAATDATKVGLSNFDSARFTVDANGFVSINGAGVGETITGNSGGALSPTAGNWNILGASTAAGTSPVTTSGAVSTLTVNVQKSQALAATDATKVGLANFNSAQFTVDANGFVSSTGAMTDLHTARYIVSAGGTADGANYTTVATAYAAALAAGAPQTVFLQPGTYTENLTLSPGINLCTYNCDAFTPNVTIIGKLTATFAGSCSISGIRLQTNSDNFLAVTGSSATIVNLVNCYLNCSNNTGITFSSSSSSAVVNILRCNGNLATTGIGLYSHSSTGTLLLDFSKIENTGLSTTASTASAGNLKYENSYIEFPTTTSGTNTLILRVNHINTSPINTTALTVGGSGTNFSRVSYVSSGTASSISIGSNLEYTGGGVSSTNTNTITGAGTLTYESIACSDTSVFNTTTQTPNYTMLGKWKASGQPAFLATDGNVANVTGDGTTYTMGNSAALTEIYDQNSNFNTNGTFTAPVTGKFRTHGCISLTQIGAAHNDIYIQIVASNRTLTALEANPFTFTNSAGSGNIPYCADVDVDAADTVTWTVTASGSTKTIDISLSSIISGSIIC